MSVTESLQGMVRTALCEEPRGALDALVGHVATATGSPAAVLWVRAQQDGDAPAVTRLAAWHRPGAVTGLPVVPDATTIQAFVERSVATPDLAGSGSVPGTPGRAVAAFATKLTPACEAVLSLYGQDDFTDEAFDVAVDLLDVLPELAAAVQHRQARALADRCHAVLRAGPGSPNAVPADLLQGRLGMVCDAVAAELGCSEVWLRLHAADGAVGPAEAVACGSGRGGGSSQPVHGGLVLSTSVLAGDDVSGVLGCRRSAQRPFTPWDVAVLGTVAEQLGRDWTLWARHWSISAEIASWRALARSITELNERLSGELEHNAHRDDRVYEAAQRVVGGVVSDFAGGHVWRVGAGAAARRLVHVHAAGADGSAAGTLTAADVSSGRLAAHAHAARRQQVVVDRRRIARDGHSAEVGWVVSTPIGVGEETFGVLDAVGTSPTVGAIAAQVCRIVADHLGLYLHLRESLDRLRETRRDLERTICAQAETLEDLEHQLVSPLINATNRVEGVLRSGRLEGRSVAQLRAVRGLCRKAYRVAMSAGVFAALSKGRPPTPKLDFFSAEDLVRMLVNAADDAQQLSDPRRGISFTVERDSVRGLGRRLVRVDQSFLHQCVGNLLDNAAKYGYADTCVRVGGAVRDDRLEVSVTSLGIRLQESEAHRCLERNWRGVQAKAVTGEGSGLGLWIATQLMQSMQGNVRVVPAGDTTTVTLTVPLS